jgi:hypothetical protein
MGKHSHAHSMWQLENLETRQLLSAAAGVEQPLVGAGTALIMPLTATPSILGTWKGSAWKSRNRLDVNVTMEITGQSSRGVLSGTQILTQPHSRMSSAFAFTGQIKGNSFTMTVILGRHSTVTASGTVSRAGNLLTGTWIDSVGDNDTFSVALS